MRRPVLRLLSLAGLAVLAACGTPREQCLRNATHDLRTLDRLIAEQRATLARGYAYERREVIQHRWQFCDDWVAGTPRRMCYEPVWDTVKEPVAIDPLAERRKLEGLLARRQELLRTLAPAIAACREKYPE